MTKRNILAMTSLVALSAIISTASKAEDFCNKEHLSHTPAILESKCLLEDIHKEGNKCHILAHKCIVPIFNAKTDSMDHRTDLSFEKTILFDNNESLKTLHVFVTYPRLEDRSTKDGGLGIPRTPGKAGDYCNSETLNKTPAVLKQGCKLGEFRKVEGNQCHVEYDNCTTLVFAPKTNKMVEAKTSHVSGTLPNDSRLEKVEFNFRYPDKIEITYGLAVTK